MGVPSQTAETLKILVDKVSDLPKSKRKCGENNYYNIILYLNFNL